MSARLLQALPHFVMLVAAALLYWAAARIDVDTGGRIGPGVWPKTIIIVMGLLCAYEVIKRLAADSLNPAKGLVDGLTANPAAREPEPAPDLAREHPRKLLGGVALVAAYVAAAPWLGFFLGTAIFLAVFPWIGGLRRPLLSAAIGIAGSFVLIVIFMRVAYISLPLGEGPFRALSLGLLRAIGVT